VDRILAEVRHRVQRAGAGLAVVAAAEGLSLDI
jgi:hypothetical protein